MGKTDEQNCNSNTKFNTDYMIGRAYNAAFLVSASFLTNSPAIWKDLPFEVCMFWGGISSFVTPFVSVPWIGLEMKFLDPSSMSWEYGLVCVLLGAGAVIQNFLFFPMVRWSGPTVAAIIRRTEVVLVLLVDMMFYKLFPNEIAIIGYTLVLLSSFAMVLAPKIEAKLCTSQDTIEE